jgi:hypothetical protein
MTEWAGDPDGRFEVSAREAVVVGLAVAFAGCGGGEYYDYDYSPAAIGASTGASTGVDGTVGTAGAAETTPTTRTATAAKPATKPKAATKAAPAPTDPAELVKSLPANPRTITDGLVRSRDWKALNWANPAQVSPWKKRKSGDDVVLVATTSGGKGDKYAVSRAVGIAVDTKGELRMDVYNAGSKEVPVAFAVFASVDRVYSESVTKKVKPGWNRVVFSLSASTFKTASSEWKNNAKLWGAGDVREIAVLFYTDKPASFVIDGIEVDGTVAGRR